MEVPKNITQIGEANTNCRIYIEDYVFSYINQMKGQVFEKEKCIGLYGTHRSEEGVEYYFLYGACEIHFATKDARHLSQAVLQDAEKQRKRYFPGYAFYGFLWTSEEMVEGITIYEQGLCRYVPGYARFYEQNDEMLSFLLAGKNQTKVEESTEDKFAAARANQERRREEHIEAADKTVEAGKKHFPLWIPAAACLGILLYANRQTILRTDDLDVIRQKAETVWADFSERQLPDIEIGIEESTPHSAGKIIAEEALTEAVKKENEVLQPVTGDQVEAVSTPVLNEPEPGFSIEATPAPSESVAVTAEVKPEKYTIRKGDTLIAICVERYGSDSRLKEICELNQIRDPDDIKVGAKILLP